jgi:AcrR family transcriptional regulator
VTERPLPLLSGPTPERRDAARNREALLEAARAMVEQCGVDSLTMDAVAAAAGVGKGTVFRRFESRAGLMAALLDFREREFQTSVLRGPPPLGPGAAPLDRLLAFGEGRLRYNLEAAQLIGAAGRAGRRSAGVASFSAQHIALLLRSLDVGGDVGYLAAALLAPLENVVLDDPATLADYPVERSISGWADLVRRVVGRVGDADTEALARN